MSVEGAPLHNADEISHLLEAEVPAMPNLDLVALKTMVRQRRDFYARVVDVATRKRDEAQALLSTLEGKKPAKRIRNKTTEYSRRHDVSEETQMRVLTALANHSYASCATLAGECGYSEQHTAKALARLAERKLVLCERPGRRYRYRITEAGMDLVTGPDRGQETAA